MLSDLDTLDRRKQKTQAYTGIDAELEDPNVEFDSALGGSFEALYFQQLDGPLVDHRGDGVECVRAIGFGEGRPVREAGEQRAHRRQSGVVSVRTAVLVLRPRGDHLARQGVPALVGRQVTLSVGWGVARESGLLDTVLDRLPGAPRPLSRPGCGRTHWIIGRMSAECAFCATALPLAEASMRSHHRPVITRSSLVTGS